MSVTPTTRARLNRVAPRALTWVAIVVFIAGSSYWLLFGLAGAFGSDALVYRGGAAAFISGNPWAFQYHGWSFSAPPLEALAFLPATLIPGEIFVILWVGTSTVAAVDVVRRLGLPAWWLAYPPLIFGVVLGNPAVVGMACLLGGWRIVGLVLRPQLLVVAGRRAVVVFAVLSALALALRPDFIDVAQTLGSRYTVQSGPPVNLWGSPLMIPALISLGLLWTEDRHAATWLVMPAVGPAMGWYGYAMVMPVRSLALALACAIPVAGLGGVAITLYALVRWATLRRSRASQARIGIMSSG